MRYCTGVCLKTGRMHRCNYTRAPISCRACSDAHKKAELVKLSAYCGLKRSDRSRSRLCQDATTLLKSQVTRAAYRDERHIAQGGPKKGIQKFEERYTVHMHWKRFIVVAACQCPRRGTERTDIIRLTLHHGSNCLPHHSFQAQIRHQAFQGQKVHPLRLHVPLAKHLHRPKALDPSP